MSEISPETRLREHLAGRTTLKEISVDIPGGEYPGEYSLVCPATPYALIDEGEFSENEALPYWAELWPSSIALARRLARMGSRLSGERVVELGCGIGLPAMVALAQGARVTATDHYTAALDFARYNAERNTGYTLNTRRLDWYVPERTSGIFGAFDLVVAADVLYERRSVEPLARLIPELLAPGGEVLIADPQRTGALEFAEEMELAGFELRAETAEDHSRGTPVRVDLHRYTRR